MTTSMFWLAFTLAWMFTFVAGILAGWWLFHPNNWED